jgi:hypothetical protein
VKKSSAKARRQRDDRAYAEFEAVMRKLAKTTRPAAAAQADERNTAPERETAIPQDR